MRETARPLLTNWTVFWVNGARGKLEHRMEIAMTDHKPHSGPDVRQGLPAPSLPGSSTKTARRLDPNTARPDELAGSTLNLWQFHLNTASLRPPAMTDAGGSRR
jgi:hypothetical protein